MPTAPNALLTARHRRSNPSSALVRKASTVPRPTHAPWPALVSDANTDKYTSWPHAVLCNQYSHIFFSGCFHVIKSDTVGFKLCHGLFGSWFALHLRWKPAQAHPCLSVTRWGSMDISDGNIEKSFSLSASHEQAQPEPRGSDRILVDWDEGEWKG